MTGSGILAYQDIKAACTFKDRALESEADSGVIRRCIDPNIRSASYDLRVGERYYLPPRGNDKRDKVTTSIFSAESQTLIIPPNELAIVEMYETLSLPADMVGHLSLKVDYLLKGIIMASQSQIDAGYEGRIWALLYNLSGDEVSLPHKASVLRLELVRLSHASERPYPGTYKLKTLPEALHGPVSSSLAKLQAEMVHAQMEIGQKVKDVDSLTKEAKRATDAAVLSARVTTGVATIIGVVAIALQVYLVFGDIKGNIQRVEERQKTLEATNAKLGTQLDLEKRLKQLESRLDTLSKKKP